MIKVLEVSVLGESFLLGLHMVPVSLCTHLAFYGCRHVSSFLFKDSNPIMRALPSYLIYGLSKAPSINTITLGIRDSAQEYWWDTNIQSLRSEYVLWAVEMLLILITALIHV